MHDTMPKVPAMAVSTAMRSLRISFQLISFMVIGLEFFEIFRVELSFPSNARELAAGQGSCRRETLAGSLSTLGMTSARGRKWNIPPTSSPPR